MTNQDQQSIGTINNTTQNTLEFQNVNLSIGDRFILNGIRGKISSQNILALMGPSGSGKSSLLNVLSFRRELLGKAVASGSITLNGVPLTKKDRYRIGYVMQEDIFFPALTLYETLTFYVNLRISSQYSKKDKEDIIRKLAQYMHLENCMNTIMGGGIIRGLSGGRMYVEPTMFLMRNLGERKRASVACELITDPVILLLDEPTSGLDSFMAANVINILKGYCRTRNKIVIASIHQPSSQTFHCFDHLEVLTCGKLAYEGSTLHVSRFFADCGFKCPPQWNIADFMLDVVGGNQQSIDKIVNEFKKIEREKFDDQHKNVDNNNVDEFASSTNFSDKSKLAETSGKKWPAGKQIQFQCLLRRNFFLSIEDQLSLLSICKCILVSLFVGTVWFRLQWDASHYQDILGLLYYLVIESISIPFFSSVFVFETEKPVLSRERMASMYSLLLYYTAKVLSELPALFVRPLIHTIIVYPMTGLPGGPTFLAFFSILSLANIVGMNYGLFLSSLGLRQKETLTLMVIFFILFDLFGGFFVSKLPVWLKWGKYASPMYSPYVLLVNALFSYRGLTCDSTQALQQCATLRQGDVLDVNVVLHSIQAVINPYWFILIMFVTSLILNLLTFLILRKTITKPESGFKLFELCNPINILTRSYKKAPSSTPPEND